MKKVAALVLALGMLAALCACGGESDKKTILRLNEVTHSVFYAPQYVAMSQGFFADEGLEIELTNGGGADKVMSAVITLSAPPPLISSTCRPSSAKKPWLRATYWGA